MANAGRAADAAVETMDVKAALMADSRVDAGGINVDTDHETKTVILKGRVPTRGAEDAGGADRGRQGRGLSRAERADGRSASTPVEHRTQDSEDSDMAHDTKKQKDHPVGEGVGAAGGAVAGMTAGAAVGGPAGAVVGAAVGAVAGGAGRSRRRRGDRPGGRRRLLARQLPHSRPYVTPRRRLLDLSRRVSLRLGVARQARGTWDDAQNDLESGWDKAKANSQLGWAEAKDAVRDGWHRVERAMPGDADGDGR